MKCLNFRMAKNKSLEIQCGTFADVRTIFEASFKVNKKEHHAGARLCLEILGWHFIVAFYDHRHWDFENECWEEK